MDIGIVHHSKRFDWLKYGVSVNAFTVTGKIDFILWEDAATGALRQSDLTAMDYNGLSAR
ncbi:MAG: hypothetical protein R2727_05840 [Bacteroidales bacterium]